MDLEDLIDNFSKLVLNTDPDTKINLKDTCNLDKIIESISQIKIIDDDNNEIPEDDIKNDVKNEIKETSKEEINLKDLLKSIFISILKRYGKSCGIETKKDEIIPDYLY